MLARNSSRESRTASVLPSSLQVSIVTFEPDLPLLERTLDTLAIAIEAAQDARVLKTVHVALVDNRTPNASTSRGCIRPLGIGRNRVRDIRSSMSRSMYMFTAFAPPAMR